MRIVEARDAVVPIRSDLRNAFVSFEEMIRVPLVLKLPVPRHRGQRIPQPATVERARAMEDELRRRLAVVGRTDSGRLDSETLEGLKALGYIE